MFKAYMKEINARIAETSKRLDMARHHGASKVAEYERNLAALLAIKAAAQ